MWENDGALKYHKKRSTLMAEGGEGERKSGTELADAVERGEGAEAIGDLCGAILREKDSELIVYVEQHVVKHREAVLSALAERTVVLEDADEISALLRAMMSAGAPAVLSTVLERVLQQGSVFAGNRSLQNLLLVSLARSAEPDATSRLHRLLRSLDNYSDVEIAELLSTHEPPHLEGAFIIYSERLHDHSLAVNTLLRMRDSQRAEEYYERVTDPAKREELREVIDDWRLREGERSS
jgi:DNA-binding phage protein